MSFYRDVFVESLGAALIVPVSGQPTFFAMHAFGGYNMQAAAVLGVAGAMLALAADYAIGGFLCYLRQQGKVVVSNAIYEKVSLLASKRLLPLLLLSWMPFGALLTVAAGFLNVPAWKTLPVVLLGQAGYYVYCGFFLA